MNLKLYGKNPGRLSAGNSLLRLSKAVITLYIACTLFGCMSNKIVKGRQQFYAGDPVAAANTLSGIKAKKGKDQILALLEYGLANHVSENYQISTEALLEADRIIEKENVVHIGEATGSLVTNEMITTFMPESFEWVLVHTYLSMNFMIMDDWSAARVEAKKALNMLDGLHEDLQEQPFTRYVCGLAHELMQDNDDAYIEYKRVVKSVPDALPLYMELYRLAMLNGKADELEQWKEKIEALGGKIEPEPKAPNLIIFVGAGRSPVKQEINIIVPPRANRIAVPDYRSSGSLAHHAILKIGEQFTAPSYMLTDLDPLAEITLKKRMKKIIAKQVARVVAKEAITQKVGEQNALAGLGVRVVMFATEAADIRSWQTLPRYMGVVNYYLPPGTYNAEIEFVNRGGMLVSPAVNREIVIKEGRRTIISIRSVR